MPLLLALFLVALSAFPASADDDLRFRRTTPRAALEWNIDGASLGVPSGRAWGVESRLRLVPRRGGTITVDLTVNDPAVREAFVRMAWYEQAEGRPRQIATDDSDFVRFGEGRTISIDFDPPEDAVAYRVRILARLQSDVTTSEPDAIHFAAPWLVRGPIPLTRLLP